MTNDDRTSAIYKLKPYFLQIELALAFAALIGLLLKIYHIHVGNLILIISLGMLSIFYILTAYVPVEVDEAATESEVRDQGYGIFANKMTAFSSAITVVGILFSVMRWPSPDTNLYAGMLGLIVALLLYSIKLKDLKKLPRIVILLALGLGFLLTPRPQKQHGKQDNMRVQKQVD